jgi:general secretion pathway protein D
MTRSAVVAQDFAVEIILHAIGGEAVKSLKEKTEAAIFILPHGLINMFCCKKIAPILALAAVLSPAEARTRKGDRLLNQGREAEVRKEYDRALELFEQALSEDPGDPAYQLAMRRARFQAGQKHVELGLRLRRDGKLAEALAEFEKGYAIDPSSMLAEQEVRRTRAMIERNERGGVAPEDRALTPAEVAKKEQEERISRYLPIPELQPISTKPLDLTMRNAQPRTIFETIGKLAGINVVFDADPAGALPTRTMSVEFQGETLERALDHVATLTRAFWKPLSPNTIFITQDNTTKRRDYEEQVVKTFYLKNVNTPQELQEFAVNLRTLCNIRTLGTVNSQRALIIKAEADKVALAEKMIADMDKPRAEVVIDVLVLETSRSKDRTLGFGLDGINVPIAYNGKVEDEEGNESTAAIPLNRLRRLSSGDFSLILPSASIQAVLSDRNTRVLQSPQVRAVDSFKSILKIGDRVPTASGSFQPGIGGVGINPLVNTQFQYIDVGVNVDITPTIHGTDEVSLHVDMDLSTVRDRIDLGGIEQPVIGQRKVTFDVRLIEGEVSVLGGLMQDQRTQGVSGVPGFSAIPLLGRLFSREITNKADNELLFVLIPHIVRGHEVTDTNLRGIAVGNEQVIKLNMAPRRTVEAATPAAAPAAPPATAPPATAPPATAPPATAPPATAPPPAAPPKAAAPSPAPTPARVSFTPSAAQSQVGSTITVTLMVENATDLFTTPFRINFDPKIVRLNDVTPGPLLTSDGGQILPPSKNIQNDTGDASVTLTRVPGAGGVTGSGALATFIFQAVGPGTARIMFSDIALRDSKLQQIPAAAAQLAITVR